jgi:hypothetical protein
VPIIETAELRKHGIASSVDETRLEQLRDAAEMAIERHVGALGPRVDVLYGAGDMLPLGRRTSSVTAVRETVRGSTTVLDPTDFELTPSGRYLRRLEAGPNPRREWGERVIVESEPSDNRADRIRVLVGLVKLDLGFSAHQSESAPDYQRTRVKYEEARRELLDSLLSGSVTVF